MDNDELETRLAQAQADMRETVWRIAAKLTQEIETDLTISGWRVDEQSTYIAAQVRYIEQTGELPKFDAFDYKVKARIVLTATCAQCQANVAQLFISDSTPYNGFSELARYAYWVPLSNYDKRYRCKHSGVLPNPESREIVAELTRALTVPNVRGAQGDVPELGDGRVKLQPSA